MDVKQLSAKQLFELANKKLQQEQQDAQQIETRAAELRKKRQQLVAGHEMAIAAIEKEFLGLKQRRDQLIAEHEARLSAVEKDLAKLSEPRGNSQASEIHVEEVIIATAPAEARALNEEELANAIVETLRGRPDMSEGLLREKLRAQGHSVSNLNKVLDRLVREGTLGSKGGGNYSLKKKL